MLLDLREYGIRGDFVADRQIILHLQYIARSLVNTGIDCVVAVHWALFDLLDIANVDGGERAGVSNLPNIAISYNLGSDSLNSTIAP